MALRGWVRVPGTAGRYRPPANVRQRYKREGKLRAGTVSRRTYENERAQKAGWRNWSEYQRTRITPDYNRWVNRAIVEQGLTRRDIGPGSEFSRLYLEVQQARDIQKQSDEGEPDWETADRLLKDAGGPLAQLLVYVGLRPEDAEYDVGRTP